MTAGYLALVTIGSKTYGRHFSSRHEAEECVEDLRASYHVSESRVLEVDVAFEVDIDDESDDRMVFPAIEACAPTADMAEMN